MKTALLALRDTQALLSDRNRWTQRVAARNAAGERVYPWASDARQWCLDGGAIRCGGTMRETLYDSAVGSQMNAYLVKASRELYGTVAYWLVNDDEGYDAAMAILARAIELAEADTVAVIAPAQDATAAAPAVSMTMAGG